MDVQLDTSLSSGPTSARSLQRWGAGQLSLLYWGISVILGLIFLRDWLWSWNVPATLANPNLVLGLVVTFACGQALYFVVARHDGRPVRWGSTLIFAVGNGIAETLAFALVYRLGEVVGSTLAGMLSPAAPAAVGFWVGLIFFTIYGGLIHALFWLPILPPHLDDSQLSRRVRKIRPVSEIALVVCWSLCLWLYRDIWTIVFFHILVDIGLMLLVRPPLFQRTPVAPVSLV